MGDKICQISSHQPSFFNRPIDHQSTSNDRLKPVMTTGLVNMHIDGSIANLADEWAVSLYLSSLFLVANSTLP